MRMVNISNEKSMQSYTARCSRYKNKYTNLVCGKTAVGRNYNLPRDNMQITVIEEYISQLNSQTEEMEKKITDQKKVIMGVSTVSGMILTILLL